MTAVPSQVLTLLCWGEGGGGRYEQLVVTSPWKIHNNFAKIVGTKLHRKIVDPQ